jgi:hypothetical protein
MLSGLTRLSLLCLMSAFLVFLQGCAGSMLQTAPVGEQESRVAASAFARYQELSLVTCKDSLDAEVDATVRISGWFSNHQGKLSGYLQALEPGYIKFIALNPLGQPVLVFLSNGNDFKLLNTLEGRAYTGPVDSETFKKFAPTGFEPETSYYWLTGRVEPGAEITRVLRDKKNKGYWFRLKGDDAGIVHMILFAPEEARILHRVIMNGSGDPVLDVGYEEYRSSTGSGEGGCMIPSRISVASNSGMEKKIELNLYSFISGAKFSSADFDLEIPANLEKLTVH